jgi:hypothetical protein
VALKSTACHLVSSKNRLKTTRLQAFVTLPFPLLQVKTRKKCCGLAGRRASYLELEEAGPLGEFISRLQGEAEAEEVSNAAEAAAIASQQVSQMSRLNLDWFKASTCV